MVRRRLPNPILGTQDKKTSAPEGRLSFFLLPSPPLTTPPRLSSRAQPRDLLFAFRFSLFAFRFSLFAFRFSLFAFRFSPKVSSRPEQAALSSAQSFRASPAERRDLGKIWARKKPTRRSPAEPPALSSRTRSRSLR